LFVVAFIVCFLASCSFLANKDVYTVRPSACLIARRR